MKIEVDSFSGSKIYPGRGTLFVRGDSKIFRFQSSKSASLFQQRKNPRRISWTVLYRRHHKKVFLKKLLKENQKDRQAPKSYCRCFFGIDQRKKKSKPSDRKAARDSKLAKDKEAKKLLKLPEKLKRLRLLLLVLLLFLNNKLKVLSKS